MKAMALAMLAACAALCGAVQQDWPKIVENKVLYADHDFRGKKAPAFFVGKWINVPEVDRRGKIVLIEFFATGSDQCEKMVPVLNDFVKKFKDKLIVMAITDESADAAQKFVKTSQAEFCVGIDPKHHMMSEIGVKGIPYAILVSPDDIVRWQGFTLDADDTLNEKIVQQVIDASAAKPIKR
ncbi:MAG TPA: TlpA disulfide reductase family protein [Fimbriimonadaceae bacterium]|nr:TlpA disulfide reductase family protein [Fimbriimonadaceae bacterium]